MTETKTPPRKKKNWALWLILILLLLTFFIQWQLGRSQGGEPQVEVTPVDSTAILDSLKKLDSLLRADSLALADSLARLDSIALADSLARLDSMKANTSTVGQVSAKTSVEWSVSSAPELSSSSQEDTLAPQVKVDPVSGRYFDQVELDISCQDVKEVEGKRTLDQDCQIYEAETIFKETKLTASRKIQVYAQDAAGNRSATITREYIVVPRSSVCGANSVPVGGVTGDGPAQGYCVDQYEWPNKLGEKPKTFLSQAEAVEACQSVGKRLCSAAEWQGACQGPQKTAYPYGQSFESSYCTTSSKSAGRSGRKKNCRSWYGAYDMAGNVWEWTSTPSPKRNKYFIVSGGSWNSVNQTSCGTTKYSFFPQNQYPMVGFRCCSDQK